MRRLPLALAAALLAAPLPAMAQTSAELVYSQPLTQEAIRQVQERLREAGAYGGRADGVWGPESRAALERFQQSRGLQVTGQLNPATAATLGLSPAALVGDGRERIAAPAAGAIAGDTLGAEAVRQVQSRLRSLGYYRAEVDGIWGPRTQAAIEEFQQGRGLQATGQLNPATVQALGLDPSALAAR
ncbi:peptidoglycan-binding domain-containing protein [Crenalkalicoccus roseus]|uniref:peptidoglycan-binding domain-containing protein n=1 Tax=Crenalkalicoccus roseus TaxID=1485588 RepID=UPI0013051981|nr:peptidoglycan-binding protein [Crenalkalicoccus roseus]